MIKILPPVRHDSMGAGYFGAPRGSRKHNGVDFSCYPESKILAPVTGEVTKLGYPYGDERYGGSQHSEPYRYVEVTAQDGKRHRVFYIKPSVEVGEVVVEGRDVVGYSQDLTKRHGGAMVNHVHYEIMVGSGYESPTKQIDGLST